MTSPDSDVPEGFADLGHTTQGMMFLHQFLESMLLQPLHKPDADFTQIQGGFPISEP